MLLDKLCPRTYSFERGDVVYLRTPSDPDRITMQRLVALEGDWVTAVGIHSSSLFLNKRPLFIS